MFKAVADQRVVASHLALSTERRYRRTIGARANPVTTIQRDEGDNSVFGVNEHCGRKKRRSLLARIAALKALPTKMPVLPFEIFSDGNDDLGSIGSRVGRANVGSRACARRSV